VEVAALRDTEGFVGNGGSRLYEEGRLGPPLWAGGDGTAERRYLETVRLVVRQFSRLLDFGYHSTRWHLLVGYLPYPDEALHLWKGYLDPTLPGFDAALAARLRPYMDEVLRISDGYVGHLLEHTRNDQVLAVAADHGQIGIDRVLRPNVVLVRAGLLALDPSGGIDLFRTQAIYFPGNSGYFLINRAGRPGGIVRPEDEDGVRARLTAALRAVRDPEDGHEVVTELIDVRAADPALGVGGPSGGDVYLNLAPRYYLSAATRGDPVTRVPPAGEHMLDPGRRDMRAAFALAGPGVAAGADLGLIRQVDIAPTLCALLGIDPPPETVGSALTRALDGANLVPATAP
jgi:predicted AlkP superfamily phosphohydrolase/phosphomutase